MIPAENFKPATGQPEVSTSTAFHDELHKLITENQNTANVGRTADLNPGSSLHFGTGLFDNTTGKPAESSCVKSDDSFQLQVKLMSMFNDKSQHDAPQQFPHDGKTDVFPSGAAKVEPNDWAQKWLDKQQADKTYDDLAQQIKLQQMLWEIAHPGSQYAPRDSYNDSDMATERGTHKHGHDSHEHKDEHKKTESQWVKDCQEYLNKFYEFILTPIVALKHLDKVCAGLGKAFCDTVKELADYVMDCAKHGTKPTEKMINQYMNELYKDAEGIGKKLHDKNFGALLHDLVTNVGDGFKDLGNPLGSLGRLGKAAELAQKIAHYHQSHSSDREIASQPTYKNVLPVVELYEDKRGS